MKTERIFQTLFAIFLVGVILFMSQCMPTIYERAGKSVVVDKYWNFSAGYFLVLDKNGTLYDYRVSRKEFQTYNDGDTIKKQIR